MAPKPFDDFESFEEQTDRLLLPIYEELASKGVPEERMPTAILVVSHLVDYVDPHKLKAWIKAYAAAEGRPKL